MAAPPYPPANARLSTSICRLTIDPLTFPSSYESPARRTWKCTGIVVTPVAFAPLGAVTNAASLPIAPGSPRTADPPLATVARPNVFCPLSGSAEHSDAAWGSCPAAAGATVKPVATAAIAASAARKRVRLLILLPSNDVLNGEAGG
jgi:hypothetical protein